MEAALDTLRPYPGSREPGQTLEEKVYAYFERELDRASLESLAGELGYSAAHTGALVRETLGASFTELLQRKRVETAARLLRTTNLPVGEIIRRVGYRNESFFRERFRKTYGKSPLAYRKNTVKGGTCHE